MNWKLFENRFWRVNSTPSNFSHGRRHLVQHVVVAVGVADIVGVGHLTEARVADKVITVGGECILDHSTEITRDELDAGRPVGCELVLGAHNPFLDVLTLCSPDRCGRYHRGSATTGPPGPKRRRWDRPRGCN